MRVSTVTSKIAGATRQVVAISHSGVSVGIRTDSRPSPKSAALLRGLLHDGQNEKFFLVVAISHSGVSVGIRLFM